MDQQNSLQVDQLTDHRDFATHFSLRTALEEFTHILERAVFVQGVLLALTFILDYSTEARDFSCKHDQDSEQPANWY